MRNADLLTKHGLLGNIFIEVRGKAICLVCVDRIAVMKAYNLSRRYKTKHAEIYKNLTDAEMARILEALVAKLQKLHGLFTKLHTSGNAATKTSFVIFHKIVQNSKPTVEGELIKECLVDFTAQICPEKTNPLSKNGDEKD